MAKAIRTAPVFQLGSDFDAFLFAPIVDDSNGMLLSVVSALARRDVDLWEEAALLAQMPEDTAIQRLGSLIAALPSDPLARPNPGKNAVRLIALLPRRIDSNLRSRTMLLGRETATHSPPVNEMIFYWIFMALILSTQWIVSSYQSPTVHNATVPAATAVSSQVPPPNAAE